MIEISYDPVVLSRWVIVMVVLGACRPEGDHCEEGVTRCDGERAHAVCKGGGANDDLLGHRSNYWYRTDCAAGTVCVRAGAEVGCADPTTECDPTKHAATVKHANGTLVVTSCTHHVGVAAYLETLSFVACDPKTYVRRCRDGQSATACTAGRELRNEPAIVKGVLGDSFVEELRSCSICGGDPNQCNN